MLENRPLRSKFLLITIACATISLMLYGLISMTISYKTSVKDAEQTLAVANKSVSQGVVTFLLTEQKKDLKDLAGSLAQDSYPADITVADTGQDISKRLKQYDGLIFLDSRGHKLWGSGILAKETAIFDTVMMIGQTKPSNVIDGYVNADNSSFILQGTKVRRSGSDYYLFGALTNSNKNLLYRAISNLNIKDGGFCAIFANSKQSVEPLYAGSQMPDNYSLYQTVNGAPFNKIMSVSSSTGSYYYYKTGLPKTPLYTAFFIPRDEVLAGLYGNIISQLLAFLILVLLVWYFVGSSVSKVTIPLEILTRTMSQVAHGKYDVPIRTVTRTDEIGIITNTFVGLLSSIREYNEKLKQLAIHDPLTGLLNRQELDSRLETEWSRSSRYRNPLSFLMIDIDFFKFFNDDFGHETGDEVLQLVAKTISENIRISDTVFRYGGEEFCVILPETNLEQGALAAEKLRRLVEELPPLTLGDRRTRKLTISIGVSAFPECALIKKELTELADAALYEAKDQGRNKVVCSEKTKVLAPDLLMKA